MPQPRPCLTRLDDSGGARWFLAGQPLTAGSRVELKLPDQTGGVVPWTPCRWELTRCGRGWLPILHMRVGSAMERRFVPVLTPDGHGWQLRDRLLDGREPAYALHLDEDRWPSQSRAEHEGDALHLAMQGEILLQVPLPEGIWQQVVLRWPGSSS